MTYSFRLLKSVDTARFKELMQVFAAELEEPETYLKNPPSNDYVRKFLADERNLILIAEESEKVVGGLAAYVLEKFEQERKEIFVYDLAVAKNFQRQGVGTGLLNWLKAYANEHGCYQIFVEAEAEDPGAVEFYRSLRPEEEVAQHFTIKIKE